MLKILILALISVHFVQSTSYEQTRDCLHGPEFWCKSVQNARYCGAFKHCLDSIWSTHHRYLINDPSDTSCNKCIDCLHDNTKKCQNVDLNLNEISDLFMASIPSVTICKLVDGCKNDDYINVEIPQPQKDTIYNNLDDCKNLHPRTWCDSIENARKCNSIEYCRENIWNKLRPVVLDEQYHKSDAPCGFCIWVFNKLHEVLQQNLTEFSVQQYLLGACTLLPSKSDQDRCVNSINEDFPELYNLVRNSMDPGIICRVIKLCKDEHLTEKVIDGSQIKIKVLNPDEVIVTSPLQRKQNLIGTKSEILVSKLAKSSGVSCELCSLVLNGAKYLIDNKKEEDQVLDFIKSNLCGRLGSLNSTCVEYINTEGKAIIDALIKNIDPSLICHKMGLCLNIQITSQSTKRFFDINMKDPSNCTLCKLIMTEVKSMLADKKSENEMLDYIRKNLCEKSAQYADMCKTVVSAYGPLILEFLANDINPTQICQLIGMCQKETIQQIEQPIQKSNTSCALCEFVMTTLSTFVTQNSSSTEVEKWLEYVCELLPSTIRDECKQFVSEYEPAIVALLSNQIQPQKICQFINLCPKSADFKVENFEQIKSTLEKIQHSRFQDNKPECVLCEFLISTLSKYITQNSSSAEVEKWLEYVCKSVMPSTIKQECSDFVAEYGPIIIQLLSTQVQPSKVCSIIKVCTNSDIKIIESLDLSKKVYDVSPVYCDACQFTLQFLEYELNKDKSNEAVTKAIENACKVAPESMRDNCNSIVETYGVYLIDMLEKANPLSVCYAIKLCSQKRVEQQNIEHQKIESQEVIVKSDSSNYMCSLCLYVAELVNEYLTQNKTTEEIKYSFEGFCLAFPPKLYDQCISLMDNYAIYVMELLGAGLEPHEACKKVQLCPANDDLTKVDYRSLIKNLRNKIPVAEDKETKIESKPTNPQTKNDILKLDTNTKVTDFKCSLCLYVAEILDGLLKQNKTDEEIKQELEKICNYFPQAIKDQCVSFLDEYAVYVLELLASDLDPKEACEKVKLCPANTDLYKVDFRSLTQSLRNKIPVAENKETKIESKPTNPQTKNDILKLDTNTKVNDFKCSLCIYVAEILDGLLKQNKTDEEIKQALEKICNYFSQGIKDQCVSFLDEYAIYVLELLSSDLDPKEACQKVKLCPANSQIFHVDFRSLLKAFRNQIVNKKN